MKMKFSVVYSYVLFSLSLIFSYSSARAQAPASPTGLYGVGCSGYNMIAWSDNSSNETGFKIERSVGSSSSFSYYTSTGANVNAFTDNSVSNGTVHYYRVYSYNASGSCTYFSNSIGVMPLASPVLSSPSSGAAINGSSANLQWSSVTGANRYAIDMGTSSGGTDILDGYEVSSNSYTKNNLSSGTYYWRVRAMNSNYSGLSSPSGSRSFTISTITVPNSPTNLNVVGTTNKAVMNWSDNSNNETGFKIQRKVGTSGSYSDYDTVGSNENAYMDTSVSNGTVYYYRVYAYNSAGNSPYYSNADYGMPIAAPSQTSPASGATVYNSSVNLQWNAVAGAERYLIDIGTSSGSSDIIDNGVVSTNSFTQNGLAAGTYYWRVQAGNVTYQGASDYSSWRSFTVSVNSAPTAPSQLQVVGNTGRVLIKWTDTSSNETGFKIERRIGSSGSFTYLASTGSNVNVYEDVSLTNATIYYYRVYAYNSAGNSGYLGPLSGMPLAAPILSSPANGATINGTSVNLQWGAVTGAEAYLIDIGTTNGGSDIIHNGEAASTNFTQNNLAKGTYYWRVQAANTIHPGVSNYSSSRSFTINTDLKPNTPATPQAVGVTGRVMISWTDNSTNETGFVVERKVGLSGSFAYYTSTSANINGYNDTSVINGNVYDYRIYAYNSAGVSGYSSIVSTMPLAVPSLGAPDNGATFNSGSSVTMNWNGVAGAESYSINMGTSSGATDVLKQAQVSGLSFKKDGLPAGTYYWCIQAVNGTHLGMSDQSAWRSFTIGSGLTPATPSNLVVAGTTGKVLLEWKRNSNNESGFKIERKTGASGNYVTLTTVGAGTINYDDTNVVNGTVYYYRVYAYNANGSSTGYSNEASGVPLAVPSLNSPGQGASLTNNVVTLQWSAVSGANYYCIDLGTVSGSANILSNAIASGLNYQTGALTAGTYYWRIRSVNLVNSGLSDASAWRSFTITSVVFAPPILLEPGVAESTGIAIDTLTPTLKWQTVPNAARYAVYVSEFPYGSTNSVYTNMNLTGNSCVIPSGKLTYGKHYRWNVRAYGTSGQDSGVSTPFYFQTSGILGGPVITGISPDLLIGSNTPNTMIIKGTGFVTGATLIWHNITSNIYDKYCVPNIVTSTEISIDKIFGGTAANWSVQVVNPNLQKSNEMKFSVTSISTTGIKAEYFDADDNSYKLTGACTDGTGKVLVKLTNLPPGISADQIVINAPDSTWNAIDSLVLLSDSNAAIRKFQVPDAYPGGNLSIKRVTFDIRVSGQPIDSSYCKFNLARPPVMLIHGVWSSSSTWDPSGFMSIFSNGNSMITSLKIAGFKYIYAADYSETDHKRFNENRDVAYWAIKGARNLAIQDGFLAKKVDVVAHSMGGILTRWYLEGLGGAIPYGSAGNRIRKFITIGTPHSGSQMANLLILTRSLSLKNKIKVEAAIRAITLNQGSITHEVLDDLAVDSQAIDNNLNNSANLSSMASVPSHAIIGIADLNQSEDTDMSQGILNVIITSLGRAVALPALGYPNDLVVSGSSQAGGLVSPQSEEISVPSHIHEASYKNVDDRVIVLLDADENGSLFNSKGFDNPTAINFILPTASQITKLSLQSAGIGTAKIDMPVNGANVSPGANVTVQVTATGTINKVFMGCHFGSVIDDTVPYEYTFTVPSDFLGDFTISAVGRDDDGIVESDTIALHVTTDAVVKAISITPNDNLPLTTTQKYQLSVFGAFTDGVTRDVTNSSLGTTYQSADESVATIDTTGTVTALRTGSTTIIARNGISSDQIAVQVHPDEASAPDKAITPGPVSGATNVSITTTTTWVDGGNATSYDVYFGTTNPPTFIKNQPGLSYTPGTLAYNTKYYWRVDSKNAAGTTQGDAWSFTTKSASITGDLDGNGAVTPADAQAAFQFYLTGANLADHPGADVNHSGSITPADAQEVFAHYLDPSRLWP